MFIENFHCQFDRSFKGCLECNALLLPENGD
jgi:hypothetical protein